MLWCLVIRLVSAVNMSWGRKDYLMYLLKKGRIIKSNIPPIKAHTTIITTSLSQLKDCLLTYGLIQSLIISAMDVDTKTIIKIPVIKAIHPILRFMISSSWKSRVWSTFAILKVFRRQAKDRCFIGNKYFIIVFTIRYLTPTLLRVIHYLQFLPLRRDSSFSFICQTPSPGDVFLNCGG